MDWLEWDPNNYWSSNAGNLVSEILSFYLADPITKDKILSHNCTTIFQKTCTQMLHLLYNTYLA